MYNLTLELIARPYENLRKLLKRASLAALLQPKGPLQSLRVIFALLQFGTRRYAFNEVRLKLDEQSLLLCLKYLFFRVVNPRIFVDSLLLDREIPQVSSLKYFLYLNITFYFILQDVSEFSQLFFTHLMANESGLPAKATESLQQEFTGILMHRTM